MSRHLNVALWQAAGIAGAVPANAAEVARAARQMTGQADLLIFPECFLTGYYTDASLGPVAGSVTPGLLGELAAVSSETGVALVLGSYERDGPDIFNSAFVFAPDRGLLGGYRKRMLFGPWEKRVFAPGHAPFLFDLRGFRVGVLICFDVEFPECARDLAHRGADLIVVPTALMAPYETVPRITVPARAIENQCFVAYANRTGEDAAHRYLGQSRVVGPLGGVLAAAGDGPDLVRATLDLALRDRARGDFDYLAEIEAARPPRVAPR